jgi:hypothetical protein
MRSAILPLILISCAPASVPQRFEQVALPEAQPATAASTTKLRPKRTLKEVACDGLAPCDVVAVRDIETKGDARYMVAIASRGFDGAPDAQEPLEGTDLEDVFHSYEDDVDSFGATFGGCAKFDVWLMKDVSGQIAREALLASVCNDGHGAAGVGQDEVAIKDARITREVSGGSAWRWSNQLTLDVSTMRIGSISARGAWTVTGNSGETTFNLETFSGSDTWTAPACTSTTDEHLEHGARVIPVASVALDYLLSGWRTTALAECGSPFNDENVSAQLSITAVRADEANAIIVEIGDDVRSPKDTLHVWTGSRGSWETACVDPVPLDGHFAISTDTGSVKAIKQGAYSLQVERSPATPHLWKLTFAEGTKKADTLPEGMTLTYEDWDGAKKSGKLATAAIAPKDATTLNGFFSIPKRFQCAVKDGKLSLEMGPTEALLAW